MSQVPILGSNISSQDLLEASGAYIWEVPKIMGPNIDPKTVALLFEGH